MFLCTHMYACDSPFSRYFLMLSVMDSTGDLLIRPGYSPLGMVLTVCFPVLYVTSSCLLATAPTTGGCPSRLIATKDVLLLPTRALARLISIESALVRPAKPWNTGPPNQPPIAAPTAPQARCLLSQGGT